MAWYPHFDSISPGAVLLSAHQLRERQHQHQQQHQQQQEQQQQQQEQQFHNFNRYNMAPIPHGQDNNDIHNPSQQYLTWNRITLPPGSIVPPRRSGAASVVVKGKLYMFGGYGGGTGRLDDFYSYAFNSSDPKWERVTVLGHTRPGCRENNGVVIGDCSRMYLFGGYNGSTWLNDLWMFDIDTRQWTCIQESTSTATASIVGERGGEGGGNGGEEHSDGDPGVLVAPAAGGEHRREGSLAGGIGIGVGGASLSSLTSSSEGGPSRRFGYVSVVHNNKFVLFGGFDGARWLNDMFEFDLCTKTWKRIDGRGSLPSMRSCPAWAKDDRYVYIHGGYDGVERKADFFACDLSTYTWTELPCKGTAPSPRYFHSCCIHGSKLYAYGGYNGSDRLADMLAYDFETNHWSTVDCASGERPSGRSSLVAQVHENSLYIFGGYNGSTVLNDFYRFRLRPVNVPPSALVSDMRRLMHREELSDVTFLIEGREIFANRSLLAIRSEYFEAMLFGGMSESVTSMANNTGGEEGSEMTQKRRTPIELRDISYEGFTKVLEYLYTDTVSELTWEMGMSLLISSEQFMLDRLKALCEDRLRKEICVDNVMSLFIASHRHNARGLKEISLEYILRNLHDPIVVDGLNDLKSDPDLLVEIITRSTTSQTAGMWADSATELGGSEWSER